jgi:hypothetical protein
MIQHSSQTDQWFTPSHIIELAREVLGTISLDPASSERANQIVQATWYCTAAQDGLAQTWHGSVYLNPPGGKRGNQSLAGLFWTKLMQERELGLVDHAIFMAFSVEMLQSTQKPGQKSILDFPFCVPSKRIRFVSPGVEKHAPSHSNAIVYVPGKVDRTDVFDAVFAELGAVK